MKFRFCPMLRSDAETPRRATRTARQPRAGAGSSPESATRRSAKAARSAPRPRKSPRTQRRAHAAAPLAETGTLEFVDPVVGGNRGRTTGRFNGFVLGGTTFRLGDVVLLEQISGAALDAMKLTHIARNDDEGDSDQDDLTNGRSGRAATARIGGRWIILPISPAQQGKTVAEQFERNEAGAAREVFVSSRFDFINPLDIVGTCTVVAEQALPKKLPKIAWSDRPVGDAVFFCSHRWNDRLNRPGRPIDWSEFEEIRDDAKPPIVLLGRRTLPSQSEEPLTPSRNAPSAKKPPASKPVVVIPTRQKKSSAAAAKAKPASKQSSKGARGKLTAVSADETSSDESSSSDGEDSDGADGTFESDQDDADDDDDLSSESSSDDPSTESELESDDDDFQKDTWRKAKPRTPQPKARSQAAASNKVTIKRKLAVSRSLTERIYKRAKSGPVSEAQTDFERARDMLHVGSVPESLPCRESEFFELLSYLDDAIRTDSGMCIYVSGVPGTGKTATFHGVLRTLRAQCDESLGEDEILPPFDFVEINGMKLTEPSQAYSVLWEGLTESKVSPKHAEQLLAQRFSTPSATRPMCVVLMDELDVLVTKKQSVIYNFFDWPNLAHSRLVVVAIANTMDLPERMLSNKVSSRLGLNRITFNPYTHTQLIEIVQSRLEGITAFDKSAVELCARKVGSVSGDARRALDICRRAVEIFEAGGGGVQTSGVIQTSHIDQAVKEMFASSSVQAIRRAGRQQRTFLVAVLRQIRSTGNTHVEFGSVAEEHEILCALQGIPAPAVSGLAQVCSSLAVYRLVLAETAKMGDPIQKIRLNVPPQDVQAAMRQEGDEALLRALG
nr:Origin recognition complex, subunit 1 [Polyrhizophydium stewartii]